MCQMKRSATKTMIMTTMKPDLLPSIGASRRTHEFVPLVLMNCSRYRCGRILDLEHIKCVETMIGRTWGTIPKRTRWTVFAPVARTLFDLLAVDVLIASAEQLRQTRRCRRPRSRARPRAGQSDSLNEHERRDERIDVAQVKRTSGGSGAEQPDRQHIARARKRAGTAITWQRTGRDVMPMLSSMARSSSCRMRRWRSAGQRRRSCRAVQAVDEPRE